MYRYLKYTIQWFNRIFLYRATLVQYLINVLVRYWMLSSQLHVFTNISKSYLCHSVLGQKDLARRGWVSESVNVIFTQAHHQASTDPHAIRSFKFQKSFEKVWSTFLFPSMHPYRPSLYFPPRIPSRSSLISRPWSNKDEEEEEKKKDSGKS